MPRYLEWTFLAFRLVRERRVHFCVDDPAPHFTMFDTAGSESQKLEYVLAMPANISRMRDPSLPLHVQRLIADHFAGALHEAANRCMAAARIKDAWRFHLRCLSQRHGIRFLPFHTSLDARNVAICASAPKHVLRTAGFLSVSSQFGPVSSCGGQPLPVSTRALDRSRLVANAVYLNEVVTTTIAHDRGSTLGVALGPSMQPARRRLMDRLRQTSLDRSSPSHAEKQPSPQRPER